MIHELIMIFSGTILGFGTSIATIKFQDFEKRKRALNILHIELSKIDKFISPFSKAENQSLVTKNGEIKYFNGISLFEIPNFEMITQIDLFLTLNKDLRNIISDISFDLDSAENNRKSAIPLLNSKDNSNALNLHGSIYIEYLQSAKKKIDMLKNEKFN